MPIMNSNDSSEGMSSGQMCTRELTIWGKIVCRLLPASLPNLLEPFQDNSGL